MKREISLAVLVLAAALALSGLAGVAVGQPGANGTEGTTVALQANGDALVTDRNHLDLSGDGAAGYFEGLRTNEDMQQTLLDRTLDSYRAVSDDRLGRRIAVENATIDVERAGTTGITTVRFRWTNAARRSDGRLLFGDIITSAFTPGTDRSFTITGPDEYEISSQTVAASEVTVRNGAVRFPEPSAIGAGFELVYAPAGSTATATDPATDQPTASAPATSESPQATTTNGTGPGVGVVAAAVALAVGLAGLGLRNRA